jgi:predicted MFS family arabinose efflux permease
MAWQGIAMYAALGIGSPIGLALQQGAGFRPLSAVVMALPAVGLAVALALPAPARSARAPAGGSMMRVLSAIWPQGLALALGTAPYAAIAAFIALHFAAKGWAGAGIALLAFAAGYIGVRLVFGHLPDRMGAGLVAVGSLLVEAVGQVVLWAAPSAPVAILGCLISGLGLSLVFPSFGVQAMRKTTPEVRGTTVSAFSAFFDVALGLTGPAVGVVAARYGYGAVYLVGAVAAVAGAVVGLAGGGRKSA